ncbi:putative metallo-peptidase, clan MH, family M18 [Trypanosoma cruzi]|uniref:Putative metallo-peptidase, clan MH, family M18 n=1 Tax=Trypanosoma cruzi TaxID=5693 RepID=A0A2V2UVF8_TRYCR|nr:putative metallo-peptidase, clan MH, family M18 [Trypanosoma cruzi]
MGTVRSRHVRHEGLCCRVHVSGPRAPQDEAREADPLCVVVRRGGELSRRHGAGGVLRGTTTSGRKAASLGADRHDCGDCSQGTSHFWVRVRGKAAHSSLALTGESCNAIDYATKLITKLREIAEEYRRNGTRHDFQVPFSTLSTNLISGGNASNTVPAECEFLFEFRALPNETVSKMMQQVRSYVETQLLPAMKVEFEDAEIVITPRDETPSFEAVRSALHQAGMPIINNYKVWKSGCTEAGHYSRIAGAPTVICGPHGGAIHCANEYVTPAQLDKCREFVLRVAESLKASPAHL